MSLTPMATRRLDGRRILIRTDFNVPLADGAITSTKRIDATFEVVRAARDAGGKVMLMSHLGRPVEGEYDEKFSLAPIAEYLAGKLGVEVKLCDDYLTYPPSPAAGEVMVLENVRFNAGEKSNAPELAKQYAALCDVFVMDAFGVSHREHASTCGVAKFAPEVCAGPLLLAELDALHRALGDELRGAKRPVLAVVGGAKVSGKLNLLESLSTRVDWLIPGGGIANTFLKAAGHNVGKSLFEPDLVEAARAMLDAAHKRGAPIPLPVDVVTAKAFAADVETAVKKTTAVADDDMILDIGPDSANMYADQIARANTILWNGPVGAFEFDKFAAGSEAIGNAIANSAGYSIAGGGDTLAAVEKFNIADKISLITTGGGAFLKYLEGETLPAVAALEAREN